MRKVSPQVESAHHETQSREVAPLLRASEVAHVLGVRPKRVYALVGHIAVRYAPRTLRWRSVDVQSWIEARRGRE
jgi:predicted DNA-binding transcriptional regulator AlpA